MGESRSYGRLQIILTLHAINTLGFKELARVLNSAKTADAWKLVKLVRTMRVAMMTSRKYREDKLLMQDVFNLVVRVRAAASS